MAERNALLSIELIKPIELIRSMDERFPAIVKVRARFPVKPYSFKVHLQPLRLFIHVQFHIYIYIYERSLTEEWVTFSVAYETGLY